MLRVPSERGYTTCGTQRTTACRLQTAPLRSVQTARRSARQMLPGPALATSARLVLSPRSPCSLYPLTETHHGSTWYRKQRWTMDKLPPQSRWAGAISTFNSPGRSASKHVIGKQMPPRNEQAGWYVTKAQLVQSHSAAFSNCHRTCARDSWFIQSSLSL